MAAAVPSTTPNPNAMKFTLDVTLPAMLDIRSAEAATGDPLAERIFAIPGVVMLFGTADFLTVSREEGADWDLIVPAVQAAAERVWRARAKTDRIPRTVILKLKTRDFRSLTRSHTPAAPPADAAEVTAIALALLERIDLPAATRYRLAGVGLGNFRDRYEREETQPALFGEQ